MSYQSQLVMIKTLIGNFGATNSECSTDIILNLVLELRAGKFKRIIIPNRLGN